MRDISAENLAALQAGRLVYRDFFWAQARDRSTGDPVEEAQWSGSGVRDFYVIDPNTGGPITRTFYGSGTLTKISAIPLVANVTVQTVMITLSQVAERVEALFRQYDCDQAPVQIHRGLFDPETRLLVAPAWCRFVGFVNGAPIKTPARNTPGDATLICKSHSQELTRANSDVRSHQSQQLRLENDDFFADAHVVGEWPQFWGQEAGRVPSTSGTRNK